MEATLEKLDYSMIILNHLNRISFLTSSNFVESLPRDLAMKFTNPPCLGEVSLQWSVDFLRAIIPDDLLDDKVINDLSSLAKDTSLRKQRYDFAKLNVLINLLSRKGLLLQNTVVIRRGNKASNIPEPREVFEE